VQKIFKSGSLPVKVLFEDCHFGLPFRPEISPRNFAPRNFAPRNSPPEISPRNGHYFAPNFARNFAPKFRLIP